MLIPNLSVLLAERRLTISRVSQDTGISRTTLTALTGRSARGIQFDTLNRLCQYLRVTPDALFIYLPYDLSLSATGLPGRSEVVFTVTDATGDVRHHVLACDAQYRFADDNATLESLRVRLSLPDDPETAKDSQRLVALLRTLPPSLLTDLERDLLSRFDQHVDPDLASGDYSPDLLWPWETCP